MLKKFASRKFLAALLGAVTGLAIVFGVDEGAISSVAGSVTTLLSVVVYVITEGSVDSAAVLLRTQEPGSVTGEQTVSTEEGEPADEDENY